MIFTFWNFIPNTFLRKYILFKQIIITTFVSFELIVLSANLLYVTLIIFYLFCLVPSDFISWLWRWRCDNRRVWELWVCQGVRMRVRHCLFRAVITYPITPHATMIWKKVTEIILWNKKSPACLSSFHICMYVYQEKKAKKWDRLTKNIVSGIITSWFSSLQGVPYVLGRFSSR